MATFLALIERARKLDDRGAECAEMEPCFLGLIALARSHLTHRAAFDAILVDCALGLLRCAFPQIPYCMRELPVLAVRVAIDREASAHRRAESPGYDGYFARHMNYWSEIRWAFDGGEGDDELWVYYLARSRLKQNTMVQGLTELLVRARLAVVAGSEIVQWAEESLLRGLDTPSLRLLAGCDAPPNDFEVAQLLERTWTELVGAPRETRALASEAFVGLALDGLAGRRPMQQVVRTGLSLASALRAPGHTNAWSVIEDGRNLAKDGVTNCEDAIVAVNTKLLAYVSSLTDNLPP